VTVMIGDKGSRPESFGSLCPSMRGVGQFVPHGVVPALKRLDRNWLPDQMELRCLKFDGAGLYRAVAVSAFIGDCAADVSTRGIAAVSCRVYACCGWVKICAVAPHSTISPL